MEGKDVDLEPLLKAEPSSVSIPYVDVRGATLYKKAGNAPLVISTEGRKSEFVLASQDYGVAKEVLTRLLGDRFKAKGFWSSLTKM